MKTLFLARHAPTSVKGICYGHLDVPIAIRSEDAAQRLRSTLPGTTRRVRIWTSPSARCREVATALDQNAVVDERLREMFFGAWEGRAWDDIERETSFGVWARDWRHARVPGGESAQDLDARVAAWFADLDDDHAHLAVAHAGVIRSLQVQVEGATWDEAMRVAVPHLEWLAIVPRARAEVANAGST